MHTLYSIALLAALTPAVIAAQQNPFKLTGGSVKSAYIVYDLTNKKMPGVVGTYELGVTPDRWLMRMEAPYEISGKKGTMKTVVVATGDSQYTYLDMGPGTADGEVSIILRRHLAREFDALDAAGKSRFRENLKLLSSSSMTGISGSEEEYITLTGVKKGSETIAGHKCDVYQAGETISCVLPQAPGVILRSEDKDGMTIVAKKITLNGPIPTAAAFLPKGVTWKKESYAYEEFAPAIWEHKKQSDPSKVPPAQLAKFAVAYLASPVAAKELREMHPGMGGEETGDADDGGEDASE